MVNLLKNHDFFSRKDTKTLRYAKKDWFFSARFAALCETDDFKSVVNYITGDIQCFENCVDLLEKWLFFY